MCLFPRFNYKTDLIHNLTGSARIIPVFNHTLMKGEDGAVKRIHLPPLEGQYMLKGGLYDSVHLHESKYCFPPVHAVAEIVKLYSLCCTILFWSAALDK